MAELAFNALKYLDISLPLISISTYLLTLVAQRFNILQKDLSSLHSVMTNQEVPYKQWWWGEGEYVPQEIF